MEGWRIRSLLRNNIAINGLQSALLDTCCFPIFAEFVPLEKLAPLLMLYVCTPESTLGHCDSKLDCTDSVKLTDNIFYCVSMRTLVLLRCSGTTCLSVKVSLLLELSAKGRNTSWCSCHRVAGTKAAILTRASRFTSVI